MPLSTLQEYLYNAYDIVRAWLPASDYMFVVEHAFLYDQWAGFMSEPQYENVWIDAHIYQAFSCESILLLALTHSRFQPGSVQC